MFINGKHVGDGETIIALNESGKLRAMLERFEVYFLYLCCNFTHILRRRRSPIGSLTPILVGTQLASSLPCMVVGIMNTPALHTTHTCTTTHTHTPPPPPLTPQSSVEEMCRVCGGQRFIMCLWCQGSKKGIRNAFGDLKCTVCNENALQKCPQCSI